MRGRSISATPPSMPVDGPIEAASSRRARRRRRSLRRCLSTAPLKLVRGSRAAREATRPRSRTRRPGPPSSMPVDGPGEVDSTWALSSAAEQMTTRFLDAGCDAALVVLAAVLEVEAHAPSIPSARPACRGRCSSRPASSRGVASSSGPITCPCSAAPALARAISRAPLVTPSSVPTSASCSRPPTSSSSSSLDARRDLTLPRALRALDTFDLMILDDLSYVQQTPTRPRSSSPSWPSAMNGARS